MIIKDIYTTKYTKVIREKDDRGISLIPPVRGVKISQYISDNIKTAGDLISEVTLFEDQLRSLRDFINPIIKEIDNDR